MAAFPYKKVLLIGATSGIGAGLADKLVQEGVHVIAVGRRQELLDAFAQKHGPKHASAVRFDITDRAGTDDFVNGIITEHLDLDAVLLNSGVQGMYNLVRQPASPSEGSELMANFHSEMNTNFNSVVEVAMKFLPHLQAKDYPTALIFTGSHLGLVPGVVMAAYSASKAALNMFVLCLRRQLEATGSKTKIVEFWPPPVQTELHDYMGKERGRSFGMPLNEFTEAAYGRLATGEEQIIIGGMGDWENFMTAFEKRKEAFQQHSTGMLEHFKL